MCVWQHKYPEFNEALRRCGEIVDREVENSLIKRALGYNYKETKTITENVGGIDVIKTEVFEKHMPGDVTACAIWLNNRKPQQFRRNHNVEKLKEKEQQWVKDNNIKPPFPVGSKVRILLRYYSETIGVINKIYEYETARYCVLTAEQEEYNKRMEQQGKKERQGGCVVGFEDVELVEE